MVTRNEHTNHTQTCCHPKCKKCNHSVSPVNLFKPNTDKPLQSDHLSLFRCTNSIEKEIHRISLARNASYTTLWSQPQAGLGSVAPECGKPGSGLQGVCCNTTWNGGWVATWWQIARGDISGCGKTEDISVRVFLKVSILTARICEKKSIRFL